MTGAEIRKALLKCEFDKINNSNADTRCILNEVIDISFFDNNIIAYSYLQYSISRIQDKNILKEYHKVASLILSTFFNFVNGAYALGLVHALKAIEIEETIDDLENVLKTYSDLPEEVLDVQTKRKLVERLLDIDENNIVAKQYECK